MNPADILKYGHQHLLGTLNGLPEAEWETGGVCGVWSVKNILAHLKSYEHWLAEVLSPFIGIETDMPILTRMGALGQDAFNDSVVNELAKLSPAETLAAYTSVWQQVQEELVPKVPAEKWRETSTLPWYGDEYSLDDFIVYTFYGHKREHGAQIATFRDRAK